MTDDELDVLVRGTARSVPDVAPSALDPGLLPALLATEDDRAVPVLRHGAPRRPVLWTALAAAAVVLLGLTLAGGPAGWRDGDVAPAGGAVQRYLLPEPWRVAELGLFDVERLDTGVTGRTLFDDTDGGTVSLEWEGQARRDEHRDRATMLTGVDGREVRAGGRSYEVFVSPPRPTPDVVRPGDTPLPTTVAVAVWVEGGTTYLLEASDVDGAGLLDLLGTLRPVSQDDWLAALPGGRVPPGNGVAGLRATATPPGATVAAVLDGVPLPPGLDLDDAYRVEGLRDRDQLVTPAFRAVACGWLQEWAAASAAGEASRAQRASEALAALADEPTLREVGARSTLPGQLTRYVERVVQDGADPDSVLAESRVDLCVELTG